MGEVRFKKKEQLEQEKENNPRQRYKKFKKPKTVADLKERIAVIEEILGLKGE